tara:strand:+ start:11744 stop:12580 length:837 start_codon:yes stop_codon:yes gene_type:complete
MNKKLLYLFLFASTLASAQLSFPYTQDFESEALGADTSVDLTPTYQDELSAEGVGGSIIADGANGTKVIASGATAFPISPKNHYFRSPIFSCSPGTTYTVSYDLYASNGKVNCRIVSSTDGTIFDLLDVANVTLSTTAGTIKETNHQAQLGTNTPGTITMVFDTPVGHTQFKIQLYQFGVQSFEFDNFSITQSGGTASVGSIDTNKVQLQSNLIKDSLTLQSDISITKATLINMTGTSIELSEIGNNTFDTSSIKSGFYILNVLLTDGSSQAIKIIKK